MAVHYYQSVLAYNPDTGEIAKNAVFTVSAVGSNTPIATVDPGGLPVVVRSNSDGMLTEFGVADQLQVRITSGAYSQVLTSISAILATQAALQASVSQLENKMEAGGAGVNDAGIAALIKSDSATAAALGQQYGVGFVVLDFDAPERTSPEGLVVFRVGAGGGGGTPTPTVLARDSFERVVVDSWGTAELGGAWTTVVPALSSVSGGAARVSTTASVMQGGMVQGFSGQDTDTLALVSYEAGTSGARLTRVQSRRQSNTVMHTLSVRHYGPASANPGRVDLSFDESTYNMGVLTGVGIGTRYWVKSRVTGSNPTTRQAKLWLDGTPEPTAWTATTTTATGPQTAGYGAVYFYSTGSEPGTAQHALWDFTVQEVL